MAAPAGKKPGKNLGGRPKGSLNKTTIEGREFARSIVDDFRYRERIRARALAGDLEPSLEQMLWHYAYGKPVEKHEHKVEHSFAELVAASQGKSA